MSAQQPSTFRALHQGGCFLIPNPWDAGSARFLASIGSCALATTSAGHAFSLGRPDAPTALGRDCVLDHVRSIVGATPLPVSADFQAGYGASPADVEESVALCVGTGVAGLSIEDATGEAGRPLFGREEAVERVLAARRAIDASGRDVVLTARAECFLVGHADPLKESIARLVAYAEAGADCLYASGLSTPEQIRAVVDAVAPLPVNVLARPGFMTLESLAALGVRRVSLGSAMARVAWGGFMRSAREIQSTGSFGSLADAEPFGTFRDLFED